MKQFRQRFLALLSPGVQILVGLLAAAYLAEVMGRLSHAFYLSDWLALSGPKFWSGQLWRLVTYGLLPAGIFDFLMNSIVLVVLGGMLERHWSRGELWVYCGVVVLGAGLVKVLLSSSSPQPMSGAAPLLFGLLIAWGFHNGRETISLAPFGEMTVWKLVCFAGTLSLLLQLFTAGTNHAFIMASGGVIGLLYLWVKLKWLMNRAGSVVHSERIHRLEL